MASRNGASVVVRTTSNAGSTSITVPSGTTLAILRWSGYVGSAQTMASMTLDGDSGVLIAQTGGSGSTNGIGEYYVESPTIGTVTLAWDFGGTSSFVAGAQLIVSFFKDVASPNPIRDSETTYADDLDTLSGSVDSETTDFVDIFVVTNNGIGTGSADTAVTGQTTDEEDGNYNGNLIDIAHVNTPGASSSPCEAENCFYGAAVFASIKNNSGGGGGSVAPVFKILSNRRAN